MKKWSCLLSIFLLVTVLSSCRTPVTQDEEDSYYQPLNTIQQNFYDVQTLYETAKYNETIELGEEFLQQYKRDILAVAVRYYVGSSYQKMNRNSEAEKKYKEILKTNPEDEWGKLATVGLRELQEE